MDMRDRDHPGTIETDDDSMTATVKLGGEEIGECSFEYEVCPTCDGTGTHVNPDIDRNGISPAKMRRDPELARRYHQGQFDVPCNQCGGDRVTPSLAPKTDEEEAVLEEYREGVESIRRSREVQRQERRMAMGRRV